jgi:hypothetical protein
LGWLGHDIGIVGNLGRNTFVVTVQVNYLAYEWVQQSFVHNNVWACFIKHVYHNMFQLKSKPSSGVIEYRMHMLKQMLQVQSFSASSLGKSIL